MKQLLMGGIAVCAVAMLAGSGSSQAAVITYALNEIIAGGSVLTPTPSFGSVTYSDNASDANKVDVSISLNGTGQKTLSFFFNYNDATFGSSTPFVLTGGVTTYINSMNNEQADGYTAGMFDIQTPASGNGGTEPLNFTIALAGTNLDPSDFNFTDSSGHLFNAVHIGNCGDVVCTPAGLNGDASIWVGSGPPTSVPEPASILLLGSGLLPLALLRRRKAP
jgi:hypothetical protein